ncbi:MAG: hypothetical protein KatS3mg109_0408 [Pirellulaceae bacterium]|nr:MAG: hypothetical protein KatS3mg109_0408 [Pirellulaceae bacterium]
MSPVAVIAEAVEAAKKAGYRIVYGDWGVEFKAEAKRWVSPHGCCCPIGAVLLVHQPDYRLGIISGAAKYLGVSTYWIKGFYSAVDRQPCPVEDYMTGKQKAQTRAGYRAGLTFRKKWGKGMRRFDTASLLFATKRTS